MVSELCGNSAQKWKEAQEIAVRALQVRIGLWDSIEQKMAAGVSV